MLIKLIFLVFLASSVNLVRCCVETSSNITKPNSLDLISSSSEIKIIHSNETISSTTASPTTASPTTASSTTASSTTSPATTSSTTTSQTTTSSTTTSSTNGTQLKIALSNDINEKPLLCYYGTWAVYRPGDGKFNVENIDPFVCTHIIYAFAGLNFNNEIHPLDAWNDLPDNYGKNAFGRFTALKKKNEKLKCLLAIGGWNEGSVKYSSMAKSELGRKIFAKSVVAMLEKYGFDGLDMDWEYPANRGGDSADKQNYIKLLAELREAFTPKGYLLTAAVSAGFWTIDTAYDIPMMSKYLDYINVMAYDLHGAWDQKTGHHSPLYARSDETGNQLRLNVDYAINYWIKQGAAKEKIILGIGTYGRTFSLANSQNNGYDAPITGPGGAGPYTREASTLGYNEFCEQQMGSDKWTVVQDTKTKVPYAYKRNQWIGYDDIASANLKGRYASENGLGGAMIWSIETDDFLGKCGQGKFPILVAIRKGLSGITVENPDGQTTQTTTSTTTQQPSSSISTTTSSSISTSSTTPTSSSQQTSSSPSIDPFSPPSSTPSPSSTTTGSSSQSTTQNPDGYVCKEEGVFPGNDCATFYQCVYAGEFGDSGSKYRLFVFHCPSGTVYDAKLTHLCVWPSAVPGCENFTNNGGDSNHL